MNKKVGRHRRKGYSYVNSKGTVVAVSSYYAGSGPLKMKERTTNTVSSSRRKGFFRGGEDNRSSTIPTQNPQDKA